MASFNFSYSECIFDKILHNDGQIEHRPSGAYIYHDFTVAIYPLNDSIMSISYKYQNYYAEDNKLNFPEQHKTVKVKSNPEFVYKIMKTQVQAAGGAKGLFDCFSKWAGNNSQQWALYQALANIMENTKGIN